MVPLPSRLVRLTLALGRFGRLPPLRWPWPRPGWCRPPSRARCEARAGWDDAEPPALRRARERRLEGWWDIDIIVSHIGGTHRAHHPDFRSIYRDGRRLRHAAGTTGAAISPTRPPAHTVEP